VDETDPKYFGIRPSDTEPFLRSRSSVVFDDDDDALYVMCETVILDFVHRLNYKVTTSRKLDPAIVFRYKGGRGQEKPSVGHSV
jgi:hypothetical protein